MRRLPGVRLNAGGARRGLIIFYALEQDVAVQKIGFPALEKELIAKGMVIDYGWMKCPIYTQYEVVTYWR
ncbi:hypothetical protein [Phaeodactylibacter sp.]|uniref:hypothetical protein n=1 Tax=Phaeodactylibacter sp. TaxID=1940289 RepID=UPI0025FD1115|nr:hypothetical protein [Phaeodactylibacter sp.]MCI4650623.1 hypothetical protein [Phaeodactylibacter sp.]MCI5091261.1 hypothetical protein [Phaeodactylibacter sp.]